MGTRPSFTRLMALVAVFGAGLIASPAETERAGAGVRAPVDSVGYALRPEQIERVIALSDSLEAELLARNERFEELGGMIGAIAPHDDHLYAGRVYVHALRRVEAPLAVLVVFVSALVS